MESEQVPDDSPPAPGGARALRIGGRFHYGVFHVLLRSVGRAPAYGLLRIVVFWYVLFYPSVRARGRPYLSRRFPGTRSLLRRFRDTLRHTLAFGKVLVDRALVAHVGAHELQVDFPEHRQLEDLVAEGKGVILLNSHVGCWQVAMTTLGELGKTVHLVMDEAPRDYDREAAVSSARDRAVRTIDARGFAGGMPVATSALLSGDVVGTMGDRIGAGNVLTLPVDFLGDEVAFPVGTYRMASVTSAPIAVLMSHKAGPDRYVLRLVRVLRLPDGLGREAEAYRPWVEEYVGELDAFVRKHPYQFFNWVDIWA